MKTTRILFWIFTGLFCAMMLFSSGSEIASGKDAIAVMGVLHLPAYLLPFLGIAKVLGVIGLLIPNYPRLKEWAYAGFIFDLLGATYCMVAIGGTIDKWGFMVIPLGLCVLSYIYYHKKAAFKTTLK
jgi:DoxX-like family